MWLSEKQKKALVGADEVASGYPIPTRMITNGEFMPIEQTEDQKRVEREIESLSETFASKNHMPRRSFLVSAAGMAASFLAMNRVFGDFFNVSTAEAADLGEALQVRDRYRDQMIVDSQLHFVRSDFRPSESLIALGEYAKRWNPILEKEGITNDRFKLDNFAKEVFFDSDTKIGLISAAPAEHGDNVFLDNAALAATRHAFNRVSESRRMLCHSVIWPGQDGWLNAIDEAIEVHKPDGWKGYTLGDPFVNSKYPWRMDDEKMMYPAYEKMVRSGIRTVCVHKGLLPDNYKDIFDHWHHAKVDDVGKAAKDWPELTFVIFHSGFRPLLSSPEPELQRFEKEQRIDWITDLAEIPETYGVNNVYAELGTTFGSCAITHPRLAAAILGQLIQKMGSDRVIWGTDSVWYGSPQWQIEALRRIEIPDDMQNAHGFAPLGAADGPVKQAIFSGNAARVFRLENDIAADGAWRKDRLSAVKADYLANGGTPSNTFYGFVQKLRSEGAR